MRDRVRIYGVLKRMRIHPEFLYVTKFEPYYYNVSNGGLPIWNARTEREAKDFVVGYIDYLLGVRVD